MVEHAALHTLRATSAPMTRRGGHAPLTRAGAIAAAIVGVATLAAGWPWALLLILWFGCTHALTMRGRAAKTARTAAILTPEQGRGARQVLANGGVFAFCALLGALSGDARWGVAAVGALAAAAADTWATEIGLLLGGAPRSLLRGVRVPPGTSGGVTWIGSAGGATGALFVALLAVWLVPGLRSGDATTVARLTLGFAAAGVLGGLSDSILGATLQSRRRCRSCGEWTEQLVHSCGGETEHARGLRLLDNDLVNFFATLVGALVALRLA